MTLNTAEFTYPVDEESFDRTIKSFQDMGKHSRDHRWRIFSVNGRKLKSDGLLIFSCIFPWSGGLHINSHTGEITYDTLSDCDVFDYLFKYADLYGIDTNKCSILSYYDPETSVNP